MIARIVQAALRLPAVVIGLALALAVAGVAAFRALDVEAYPNPTPPLVEVIVQPQVLAARWITPPMQMAIQTRLVRPLPVSSEYRLRISTAAR